MAIISPPPTAAGLPPVTYVRTAEDSKELCANPEPYIVVASGGMCDGGRIMTYLRQHIDDPRTTIVLVSYQAPGTLGRQLLEKRPTVRFHGRNWNKWAEVVEANGFSGHADKNDFLALLGGSAGQTGQVRLVHGEPEQSAALAKSLPSTASRMWRRRGWRRRRKWRDFRSLDVHFSGNSTSHRSLASSPTATTTRSLATAMSTPNCVFGNSAHNSAGPVGRASAPIGSRQTLRLSLT